VSSTDTVNIIEQAWDYLIILDACRYDYFERLHGEYLDGKLEKRLSVGSSTNEWRDKSFPDYYDDIVYISANPQICAESAVYGYTAGRHFCEVHEVWRDRWDRNMGTVLPETLTDTAIEIISGRPHRRFIIHYLQPHAPYLGLSGESRGYINGDMNTVRTLVGADTARSATGTKSRLLRSLLGALGRTRILTNQPEWVLRKLMGVAPRAPMESAWRAVGTERLRRAYADNLKAVLAGVAELLKYLSGTIIVTADHGELLGEGRCYGHPTGSSHRILREIPWLTIHRETAELDPGRHGRRHGSPDKKPPGDTTPQPDREQLAEKLKALGYLD